MCSKLSSYTFCAYRMRRNILKYHMIFQNMSKHSINKVHSPGAQLPKCVHPTVKLCTPGASFISDTAHYDSFKGNGV